GAVGPSTAPATAPSAYPSTQPSSRRAGVLTFLDNSVQDASGTIKLRATVPNADWYFWPGQFVRVRVILTVRKGAVLIPGTAVQIGQQGPFVFVVKPDPTDPKQQIAELRPIVP